jgi:hypothetical protein
MLPTSLLAQTSGGMNQGNMQNMMQVMQQVQQCLASIDQSSLNKLQVRSEQAKEEIDALCAQGKRDQAQKKAMAFGRQIGSDPTMKQMRKCGEIAQGALPMPDMVETYDEKEYANRHVCDE